VCGTQVYVAAGDKVGRVFDGAVVGQDVQFVDAVSTVTANFDGYSSEMWGIDQYEWAVGTPSSFAESIQPFTAMGVLTVNQGGLVHLPVAQLGSGSEYSVTVRAKTGQGKYLVSQSSGVVPDSTPPRMTAASIGDATLGRFQRTQKRQHLSFAASDPHSPVTSFIYGIGDHPYGTSAKGLSTRPNSSPADGVAFVDILSKDLVPGESAIVSVRATNAAQLTSHSIVSRGIITDNTVPQVRPVMCPSFVSPGGPVSCTWPGFIDQQSLLTLQSFEIRPKDDIYSDRPAVSAVVDVSEAAHTTHALLPAGVYVAAVRVTNNLNMTSVSVSNDVVVDSTPPVPGEVWEVAPGSSSNAICQTSTYQVSAAWNPFVDTESPIIHYEVAVGRSAGASDVKRFTHAGNQTSMTVGEFDRTVLPGESLFVTVRGVNAAGLSSVATSNGVAVTAFNSKRQRRGMAGIYHIDLCIVEV